jgi:N-acetylmuramoyl-L-alanine amidase
MDTIFLQASASPVVLLHETGHVKGRHWLDLMLLEITCIVCWINPIVWLYRKSLKQQHEYLADDYVIRRGILPEEYLTYILASLTIIEPIGPVHNFNSQSLKQRIIMMTRNQISPYTKYLYFALVPLLSVLFFSFTGTKDQVAAIESGKVFVIDAAHGGSDIGAASASGITEKEIALSLARLVKEIGAARGLNIQMTRATDEQLSLADRVKFSANVKADAFLSIHVGFDADGIHKGLEVVVSEANIRYADSKRFASILTGELDDVSEFNNPVVRSSGAYVLKHNHAPSAIVEAGYLSDKKNTEFIHDPANQRLIAGQIVSALMKY